MKKVVSLMIPLFAAVVGITACGSGSKSSMVAETTAAYTEAAAETVSNTSMTYDSASQKSESGSGGELEMDTSGTPLLPEGRKLIRNITMQVETEEFDKMISGINAKLSEAGGYIEQSDISGTTIAESPFPGTATSPHASPTINWTVSWAQSVTAGTSPTNQSPRRT